MFLSPPSSSRVEKCPRIRKIPWFEVAASHWFPWLDTTRQFGGKIQKTSALVACRYNCRNIRGQNKDSRRPRNQHRHDSCRKNVRIHAATRSGEPHGFQNQELVNCQPYG